MFGVGTSMPDIVAGQDDVGAEQLFGIYLVEVVFRIAEVAMDVDGVFFREYFGDFFFSQHA